MPSNHPRRTALKALAAVPFSKLGPLLGGLSGGVLGINPARAAVGGLPSAAHADSSPEWDQLSSRMFAGRSLRQGQEVVQLITPLRAAYGASVPIKLVSKLPQTPELYVKRLYVVVDQNPSPVAAVIDLGTHIGQADFETRLRVDGYGHVRVVSELSNGELHTDSRFVKSSGGCSAPPNRDAPHLIGRTSFKLLGEFKPQQINTAEVTVIHPNDTGFELNNVTVMYIPPHFVRSLRVTANGSKLFDAELDFSISENPNLRFHFVPQGKTELRAEVADSRELQYSGSLSLG
jgi:sulfur-oxidizing protein SoxY